MLPSYLIKLDSLPLTTNGKLDKSALPDINLVTNSYLAPQTYLETQLQQIFANILGLPAEQISIVDDFFRLGGNSLLSIKLVNQINHELNLKLKIFDIFHKKTIQAIAANSSAGLIEYAEYYTPRFHSQSVDTPILILIPGFHDGFERNYTDLMNTLQLDNLQQIYLFKNCFESFANYEDVAKYYCDIIDKLALQNIVLCGYSSGGVIAYLMAARVVKQRPLKLVLFDTYFNVDNSYLRAKRFIRKRLKMAVGEHSRLNYIPQIDVPILFFKATLDKESRYILASDRRFRWLRQIKSDMEYIVSQCTRWFKSGRLPNYLQKHMQIYKIIELEAHHSGERNILSSKHLSLIKSKIDDFLKT